MLQLTQYKKLDLEILNHTFALIYIGQNLNRLVAKEKILKLISLDSLKVSSHTHNYKLFIKFKRLNLIYHSSSGELGVNNWLEASDF